MMLAAHVRDDLGARQVRLLSDARRFLDAKAEQGVDVAVAPECYLNGWARVPGNARLRVLAGEPRAAARLALARLKEAFNVVRQSCYELAGEGVASGGYDQLVISWCRRSDFALDGAHVDRYFGTSTRETPRTLWLLIALDQFAPESRDANIRVLRRRPGTPTLDFRQLLRADSSSGHAHGRLPLLSASVHFAGQIVSVVLGLLEGAAIRALVMPYEAQPFQHAVFRAVALRHPEIETIGYLHSLLPPLPTDLIRREGAPRTLLVHGRGQAEILERHLGWPASTLRTIPSLRYRAGNAASLAGFVFLPYSFDDAGSIEAAFERFLMTAAPGSLSRLAVRNHPVMLESVRHQRLQAGLEAAMRKHADRFGSDGSMRALSVFIGATAAIFEALEHGLEVVHICSQPLLEAHSHELWAGLEVRRLGEHTFRYALAERGTYIEFGAGEHLFERYIRRPPAGN